MYLVQLVYVSKTKEGFNDRDIEAILKSSQTNNRACGITGLLTFNHSYFLQCLEGSREQVNKIYQTILQDPRHSDVVILSYEQIDYRYFGGWSMAYVPSSSLTREMILTYSKNAEFNPYEISGESALLMLSELAEHIPTA